jgi:hypothetical protein
MRVSYGPPGHKGVTTLMAVGADEYPTNTDRNLQIGVALSASVAVLGALAGSKRARDMGAGAAAALLLLKIAR